MNKRLHLKRRLLFLTFFLLTLSCGWAQAPSIAYPVQPQDITSGFGQSLLTVRVVFNAACTGTTVKVALPASVSYVQGTVAKTGGSAALAISENSVADLRNPVFNISGTIGIGTDITFTVARKASCVGAGSGKDSIYVFSSCTTAAETNPSTGTYNLLSPVLSITPPVAINNGYLGQTATRNLTVINGGNGCTDTLRFFVVYPGSGIVNNSSNTLTVGGLGFTPWRTNGDTLFYKVYGATLFGGDNVLCNGESIGISEPVKILKCSASTAYGVYWGDKPAVGSACVLVNAGGVVTIATGVPAFTVGPVTTKVSSTNECSPSSWTATFTNSGTGETHAAGMNNVKIIYCHVSNGGNMSQELRATFNNFSVGGNAIPAVRVSGSNTTTYTVDISNLFIADPDGAGVGLEDLDGDGFFDDLAPGKTFVLGWQMNPVCTPACDVYKRRDWSYKMVYATMCGTATTSTNLGGIFETTETMSSTSYVPANIVGGVPFRFQFRTTLFSNTNSFFGANGRYQYRVVLPKGIIVSGSGNPTYGNATATYSLSTGPAGDTLIITSTVNTLDSAGINLVLDCNTITSMSVAFWHSLIKINDINNPSCLCEAQKYCTIISTTAHCPIPCPSGPVNYLPVVRRVDNSLGWTDQSLTVRQSVANITAYDLCKALYLDTIQLTGTARQSGSADNVHARLEVGRTATGIYKLKPVDIRVEVWRSGGMLYSCKASDLAAHSDSSIAGMQRMDWNLCLPAGGVQDGDSIYTVSRYVVAANNGLSTADVQSGSTWYLYSKDATGDKKFCEQYTPEMYLVATNLMLTTAVSGLNSSGCGTFVPGGDFAEIGRNFDNGGQPYKDEFRPIAYIDSIVLTVPQGYDYVSASVRKNIAPHGTSFNLPIVPNNVSGKTYSFINPGSWPYFEINKGLSGGVGGNFMPVLAPNCLVTATENIQAHIYIKDYYYAFGNPASVPTTYQYDMAYGTSNSNTPSGTGIDRPINYNMTSKPNLILQNNSGVVQGVTSQQYWDVKLSSTGLNTAGYVWLALEKGSGTGNITIDSVVTKPYNRILSGLGTYTAAGITGYNWYQLSTTGIPSGKDSTVRVYFKYSSCTKDSILIKAGWSCSAYPGPNPSVYLCTPSQSYLVVDPQPSQIQLSIARQPGNSSPINLCSPDSALLIVNSAQSGNLINPYLIFKPATGLDITLPIQVEYPLGSGNYQNANTTLQPDGSYKIDLSAHNLISTTGIAGTATTASANGRQAKVKVSYATTCSFTSGTPLFFRGYGSQPCGSNALGSGVMVSTAGLNIIGASTPGGAGATFTLSNTNLSCGIPVNLDLSIVPTSSATQAGDTAVYILPTGLAYVPGSFTTGNNCSSCTVKISGNEVKVALQEGVASGAALNYSFAVQPQGLSCGTVNINGLYKRDIPPLTCGATVCSSSSTVISTFASPDLVLQKPVFMLSNFSFSPGYNPVGINTHTFSLNITNSSTVGAAAGAYLVKIYCGSNSGKVLHSFVTSAIAAGSSVIQSGTLSYTTPGDCNTPSYLYAELQDTVAGGSPACLCAKPAGVVSNIALPVTIISFSGQRVGNNNVLRWVSNNEVALQGYEVEYSTDGIVYTKLKTVAATGNGSISRQQYQYMHLNALAKTWYRLRMVDLDGSFSYSRIVKLSLGLQGSSELCLQGNGLYPVPFTNELHVGLYSCTAKPAIFQLWDIVGKKYREEKLQLEKGTAEYLLTHLSGLPAGSYILRIQTDSDVLVQKVVK